MWRLAFCFENHTDNIWWLNIIKGPNQLQEQVQMLVLDSIMREVIVSKISVPLICHATSNGFLMQSTV